MVEGSEDRARDSDVIALLRAVVLLAKPCDNWLMHILEAYPRSI